MINKDKLYNELKDRLEKGQFVEIISDKRHGKPCYRVKYGNGISISIEESSKVIYVNFAYNKYEKSEILDIIKNSPTFGYTNNYKQDNSLIGKLKRLWKK